MRSEWEYSLSSGFLLDRFSKPVNESDNVGCCDLCWLRSENLKQDKIGKTFSSTNSIQYKM